MIRTTKIKRIAKLTLGNLLKGHVRDITRETRQIEIATKKLLKKSLW